LSEEERQCQNTKIIAAVALERAKDNLNRFNAADLKFYKLERVELNNRLKARGLSEESRNDLTERKQEIEYWVSALTEDQQRLKSEVSSRREIILDASKALKEIRQKKN